mmetsp:Transcript_22219/g.51272  ORF Transcript_22219/g.51272 Transcript_22219/m.51272 type:complete len:240 (+) Transcript_22219:64-783(+)
MAGLAEAFAESDGFVFDNEGRSYEFTYDQFAVRRTICQMLEDRGYLLPVEDTEGLEFQSFVDRYKGKESKDLTLMAERGDDAEKKIMAFFPINPPDAKTRKIPVGTVREIIAFMKREKVSRAIVVVEKPLLGHAQMQIDQETERQKLSDDKSDWRVEVFLAGELKVNITRHELVPKHLVLADEEKRTLLRRYHLQEKHLPRIQKADPISRYYGLDRRQVVKIVRPSETAGWYVTYRLVA